MSSRLDDRCLGRTDIAAARFPNCVDARMTCLSAFCRMPDRAGRFFSRWLFCHPANVFPASMSLGLGTSPGIWHSRMPSHSNRILGNSDSRIVRIVVQVTRGSQFGSDAPSSRMPMSGNARTDAGQATPRRHKTFNSKWVQPAFMVSSRPDSRNAITRRLVKLCIFAARDCPQESNGRQCGLPTT